MAAQRTRLAPLLVLLALGAHRVCAAGDAKLELSNVVVRVLESDGSVAEEAKASGGSLKLDHTQSLKVGRQRRPARRLTAATLRSLARRPPHHPVQATFGVVGAHGSSEMLRPQQAFLRLTNRASGDAAYFAALQAKDGSMGGACGAAGQGPPHRAAAVLAPHSHPTPPPCP